MIQRPLSMRCGSEMHNNALVVIEGVAVADMHGKAHPAKWDALIDTGADRSVVPMSACHDLGLSPHEWRSPAGFDPAAPRPKRPLYYVSVLVPGIEPAELSVYGVDRSCILLGMDFLSKLVLAVDSRTQTAQLGKTSILKSSLLRLLAIC